MILSETSQPSGEDQQKLIHACEMLSVAMNSLPTRRTWLDLPSSALRLFTESLSLKGVIEGRRPPASHPYAEAPNVRRPYQRAPAFELADVKLLVRVRNCESRFEMANDRLPIRWRHSTRLAASKAIRLRSRQNVPYVRDRQGHRYERKKVVEVKTLLGVVSATTDREHESRRLTSPARRCSNPQSYLPLLRRAFRLLASKNAAEQDVEHGRQEQAHDRYAEHAAEHGGAQRASHLKAGAGGD